MSAPISAQQSAFTCPDHTGALAPCSRLNQNNHLGLEIEVGRNGYQQTDYCPLAQTVTCAPYLRWLDFREERLNSLADDSGVPGRLLGASLATAKPTAAVERARSYVAAELSRGRALGLIGPAGVGKTFAEVAALREFNGRRRKHGRFWYMPALIAALLDPDERRATMQQAKETGLLVLDDVGTEYTKEGGFAEACLEEIVWHREAEELATMFTSNLTVDQLRARLSDRILDRLAGEWGSIFAVAGPSLRKAAKP